MQGGSAEPSPRKGRCFCQSSKNFVSESDLDVKVSAAVVVDRCVPEETMHGA